MNLATIEEQAEWPICCPGIRARISISVSSSFNNIALRAVRVNFVVCFNSCLPYLENYNIISCLTRTPPHPISSHPITYHPLICGFISSGPRVFSRQSFPLTLGPQTGRRSLENFSTVIPVLIKQFGLRCCWRWWEVGRGFQATWAETTDFLEHGKENCQVDFDVK